MGGIAFRKQMAVDKFAEDVPQQIVRFLDSGRVAARNAKQHLCEIAHFAPRLTGKTDSKETFRFGHF